MSFHVYPVCFTDLTHGFPGLWCDSCSPGDEPFTVSMVMLACGSAAGSVWPQGRLSASLEQLQPLRCTDVSTLQGGNGTFSVYQQQQRRLIQRERGQRGRGEDEEYVVSGTNHIHAFFPLQCSASATNNRIPVFSSVRLQRFVLLLFVSALVIKCVSLFLLCIWCFCFHFPFLFLFFSL